MNTETGQFETIDEAPAKANHYQTGELVEVKSGDWYRVTEIGNDGERGRLVLTGLSAEDRERAFIGDHPQNVLSGSRKERRKMQAEVRRATKRLRRNEGAR